MFSGIIEAVGAIAGHEARDGDVRLWLDARQLDLSDVAIGDSIAVAGVCVTVVALRGAGFGADLSRETLERTTLGGLTAGAPVNLEKALRLGSRLGGHLLSGHVDGVGRVVAGDSDGRSLRLSLAVDQPLARFVAVKGSIAVDGVSLTVNRVNGATLEVNLIPQTLAATTLAGLAAGDPVNVEVDLMARYAARWLETATAVEQPAGDSA